MVVCWHAYIGIIKSSSTYGGHNQIPSSPHKQPDFHWYHKIVCDIVLMHNDFSVLHSTV